MITTNTKILFIQTGGTIDKDYPKKIRSYGFEIANPAVERIITRVKPTFRYRIISLLRKDSLDLTEKDRELIYKTCLKVPEEKIIITHGTDTMIKTAKQLCAIKNKSIIMTGSLLPEKFYDSEAMFNIGCAVGAINLVNKGVYIAMSGKIFLWNRCKKSPKTGRFVSSIVN
ncbi:MAG: asparaginase domain-containing protein [Patescibacteria group bacterium]|nr:asparaginase domain-containing protein [Patescibacteria group bacterium]